MLKRRRTLVIGVIIAIGFVAAASMLVLRAWDGMDAQWFVVERVDAPDPTSVELSEERTRMEAPYLTELLDEALRSRRAESRDPRVVRDASEHIMRVESEAGRPSGVRPILIWKGEPFHYDAVVS